MFDAFTAKNPDITVVFAPSPDADYQTKLNTALAAGKGPDIAQLNAYAGIQPVVDAGYLVALDDKIPELKQFYPAALAGAQSVADQKIYGVPYSVANMGVYYNKKIFADNGIEVPQTYAAFVAACQKLKAAGVIPIAAGGGSGSEWALEVAFGVIAPNTYGANAFWNDAVTGKTTFNDPRFVAALQRMKDLSPYYSPGIEGVTYAAATQQFVTEKAAMFMGGSWENGSFKSQNKDLSFGIFAFPPDVAGQPAYTSAFNDGSYGLIAASPHGDAALKVLQYMASADFAQQFADLLGWPVARPGITGTDENLQTMVKMQANQTPYLNLTSFNWASPTGSSLIRSEISQLMAGKADPAALAKKIQDGLSSWFKPGVYPIPKI
jgi:raffinose/stachyose/melibiose transport system substrate-binding protein